MGWAKIQYERKQLNKVLVRCKNGKHTSKRVKASERDRRRLES